MRVPHVIFYIEFYIYWHRAHYDRYIRAREKERERDRLEHTNTDLEYISTTSTDDDDMKRNEIVCCFFFPFFSLCMLLPFMRFSESQFSSSQQRVQFKFFSLVRGIITEFFNPTNYLKQKKNTEEIKTTTE